MPAGNCVLVGVKVATPLPLSATGDATALPLMLNCTVPVGMPTPGLATATVAVKVGGALTSVVVLPELVSVVVVLAWLMVSVAAEDIGELAKNGVTVVTALVNIA